ncbi:MAG: tetratricopeptide repeat protein [Desulfarculus sp.]|jgi:predicted Zn-dependent protease|nr:MAG: tetratricopeptide repeat protein [Desulfarculus sp.]
MNIARLIKGQPLWRWLGLLLLVLAVVVACAKNPVTGQDELVLMSEQQELAMGATYYPQTTQLNHGLPAGDPGLQSYVAGVGRRLAARSHRPNIPWQFNVVNTSQVNAFALPGGKISVTRGLVSKMSSEDQLAAVVGHEIGHVTARHSAAQYTRGVLVSLAVVGLAVALSMSDSDWAPVGIVAAGVAGQLLMLSYSRDQERQADELGYMYMTQNNYNPKGMVQVFEMFKAMQKSEPGFVQAVLSSHPLPSERIEAARQRVLHADPRLTSQPLKTQGFNRALALQKKRAPAYAAMDKGSALASQKRYAEAASYFQRAISLYPQEGLFHTNLALVYLQQKNNRAALQEAKTGAALSKNNFYALMVAGATYRVQGDYRNGAQSHFAASKLLPDQYINLFYLAYCLDRLGQRSYAANYYKQVVKLSPKTKYGTTAQTRLTQLGYK